MERRKWQGQEGKGGAKGRGGAKEEEKKEREEKEIGVRRSV